MDNIILTQTTRQELVDDIILGVTELLETNQKQLVDQKEWLTAKEVQELLKISSVTLYNYDTKGLTIPTKVGRLRRYRKDQILSILNSK